MPERPGKGSCRRWARVLLVGLLFLWRLPPAVAEQGGVPNAVPTAEASPLPVSPMPPATTESEYVYQMPPDTWPAAPEAGSAGPTLLRWDFSRKGDVRYDCRQTLKSLMALGPVAPPSPREESVEYAIVFRSKGNGQATMLVQTSPAGPHAPGIVRSVLPGVGETGMPAGADSAQDGAIRVLFPLPSTALRVGETASLPIRVPFDYFGTRLYATGTCKVRLTRWVRIREHRCARLEADIDASDIDVPVEMRARVQMVCRGRSVSYFDTVERSFVSGTVAMIMSVRAEPVADAIAGSGPGTRVVMDVDTMITMSRRNSPAATPPARGSSGVEGGT